MEATITSIRHNPLMERAEAEVNLEHDGEATPSEEDVKERLAAEQDWDADEIEVVTVKTGFGSESSTAEVKVHQEIDLDRYEDRLEEETVEQNESGGSSDSETQGVDYEDVVSGTIGEAKERLGDLEDPDFEAALEAEESNKDRKTLKEWLESQKE